MLFKIEATKIGIRLTRPVGMSRTEEEFIGYFDPKELILALEQTATRQRMTGNDQVQYVRAK